MAKKCVGRSNDRPSTHQKAEEWLRSMVFKKNRPSLCGLCHMVWIWGKQPCTSRPSKGHAGYLCRPQLYGRGRQPERLCEPRQHPLPLQGPQLSAACDLNTVLGDRERAGGLDLPVMPYDKPLTSLTPSNITPLKGLSAYWLKKKKGDQKMLRALESLVRCSTSCLTLTPGRNIKVLWEEGRWKKPGNFQLENQ